MTQNTKSQQFLFVRCGFFKLPHHQDFLPNQKNSPSVLVSDKRAKTTHPSALNLVSFFSPHKRTKKFWQYCPGLITDLQIFQEVSTGRPRRATRRNWPGKCQSHCNVMSWLHQLKSSPIAITSIIHFYLFSRLFWEKKELFSIKCKTASSVTRIEKLLSLKWDNKCHM